MRLQCVITWPVSLAIHDFRNVMTVHRFTCDLRGVNHGGCHLRSHDLCKRSARLRFVENQAEGSHWISPCARVYYKNNYYSDHVTCAWHHLHSTGTNGRRFIHHTLSLFLRRRGWPARLSLTGTLWTCGPRGAHNREVPLLRPVPCTELLLLHVYLWLWQYSRALGSEKYGVFSSSLSTANRRPNSMLDNWGLFYAHRYATQGKNSIEN